MIEYYYIITFSQCINQVMYDLQLELRINSTVTEQLIKKNFPSVFNLNLIF